MRTTIFILLFMIGYSLHAEDKQIPVLKSKNIVIIDAELNKKLRLFTSYKDFQVAALYESAPETYYFLITYLVNGEVKKDKLPYTKEELEKLRAQILKNLDSSTDDMFTEEARRSYLWGCTGLGFVHANFLPIGFGVDSPNIITGSYLLITGGGYLIPYLLTDDGDVTMAHRDLSLGLASTGILHGLSTSMILMEEPKKEMFLIMSGLSIVEQVLGYKAVDKYNLNLAEARMVSYGSSYGYANGWLFAGLIGDAINSNDSFRLISGGSSLAFSLGSLYLYPDLVDKYNLSGGDASALSTTTLMGYGLAANILVHTESASNELIFGSLLVGGYLGTYLGLNLGEKYTINADKMIYVDLLTTGGGIMGAGIAVLMEADIELAVHLATAGYLAGFGISYASLINEESSGDKAFLDIKFTPENLMYGDLNLERNLLRGSVHRPAFGLSLDVNKLFN